MTTMEIDSTKWAASFRFTFEEAGDGYAGLDTPENLARYFVIEFDNPFPAHGAWTPE